MRNGGYPGIRIASYGRTHRLIEAVEFHHLGWRSVVNEPAEKTMPEKI